MAATITAPGTRRPLTGLPPLSLYVHLPWCLRKCPYCDFNSHEAAGGARDLPEADYLQALRADLEAALPQVWGRPVHTVFIGGGTPSLFSPASIDALLSTLRMHLPLVADAEITMEANPGTFEVERFRGYAGAGVNRLSIGVQSFDDAALARIGRVHDAAQARAAAELASRVYPTFNLDLMYALPGQTLEALEADLATALSFSPPHLSYYQLTLEPNTVFAKFPPSLPDDDEAAAMQAAIEAACAARGLEQYEVSAYARPRHRARHNLNYWRFGDYLGLGAGAHSKLSFPDRIVRESRLRQPAAYLKAALGSQPRAAVAETRELSTRDLPFEFMLNALRLVEGVPAQIFADTTGMSLADVNRTLAAAVERGLLAPDPTVLRATALGRRFLNDLQAMFLEAPDDPAAGDATPPAGTTATAPGR